MGNYSNGIASTIFRSLFVMLGLYVVCINVIMWANADNVSIGWQGATYQEMGINYAYNFVNGRPADTFQVFVAYDFKSFGYVGFENFFDKLKTFPGVEYTKWVSNHYLNVIGEYDVTGLNILDIVLVVIRIFTAPYLLLISIVADLLNNVVWFLDFLTIHSTPVPIAWEDYWPWPQMLN